MSFIPCALEVWLQGKRVKASTTRETGLRVGSSGIQVCGALGNQVLRSGSILNVAAPLAHEGRLTCVMKTSGTQLILSQLDQSQTYTLLKEFTKLKAQIIGLKMTMKRPLEKPADRPSQAAKKTSRENSGAISTAARPLVGTERGSSSRHGLKRSLDASERGRTRCKVPCAKAGLTLTDLPGEVIDVIHSYVSIPFINPLWAEYRHQRTVRLSVNGHSATGLSGQAVVRFLQRRSRLRDVEILGVHLFGPQLKTIPNDVPHFANLRRLILRKCVNITDAGLTRILKVSQQLVVLDVVECPKISTTSFEHGVAPLQRLMCGNPRAASTRFNDIMFNKKMKLTHLIMYNASALSGMALNWFPLSYLDIRSCNLNDNAAAIVAAIGSLRHLNLAGNTNLTELGVAEIMWGCQDLETLDISDLRVDFMDFMGATSLRRLKISSCQEMRDGEEVRKGEMNALCLLEVLPQLVSIDLSYVDLGAFPEQILSPHLALVSGLQERHNVEVLESDFFKAMKEKGAENLEVCPGMRHIFEQDMKPLPLRDDSKGKN
eukprot:GEMP01009136.1.p1 GENE.GEMP01009136.1~~GEMP01009136.1.p1  ORF type:complete len:546 (+),score=81.97 GEMP01009136.1:190-1827(+)